MHRPILRYATAVAAVVLATAVRLSIVALSGSEAPYATFYLAIIITVCVAGRGPAVVATLLGGLAADYFFIDSPETFAFWHPKNAVWAVTYLMVSATLIAAIEAQRRFWARAESALAKLKKDEERLRRKAILLNLSHDAIIRADANGVVTGWNAGAREMYGISSEQAVGKPVDTLLQTRNHRPTAELREILHQTGRWDGEVVHTKADGSTIVVESRQVLEKSGTGEPLEFLEINRDVTARVLAQKELLEAHRKTTAILQSISDGFNAFDREWRYTYVNAAGAKMVHKTPEELLGKCFWKLWPHAADSALGVTYRRAVAENVPLQLESFYPEPLNAWFDVRCYPSADGLSVFFTDITERKLTEERLRQTQTLESIGLLAGGVAHDFNNLLSVIIGSAAMALHERPGCEDLSSILSAAERASALTRQLLAYAGKGRFVFEPIALSELVLRSSALLRASLPRRVNLNFALAENLPSLKGDAGQIRQILTNLVVNAAEAALPDTETVIVIATGTRTITSNTNGSAGFYVWLEVKDNGSGMDTVTKPRIFEPFYSTKFTGRGLGLAAVQGIVRSHKGFIEVNSMPGEGTSFKVFLPASAPAAALAEQV